MKLFQRRYWPLLTLALLLASVVFYLARAGLGFFQKPVLKVGMTGEGLKLKDIQYAHEDPERRVRWWLDAKEVNLSSDKNSIRFTQFSLRIEPQGRPPMSLKGRKGDYSRDTGEINLWGDLEAQSDNGYTLLTDHLIFNEKEGRLTTEQVVRIQGPYVTVDGRGLFVDLESERLTIASEVTTRWEGGMGL